ncbi:MAG: DUF262 domain-containing protein [Sulfurimonas sp.]|nr:DUF262 domain-containing protein [Sulfurimonas sp.]
MPKATFEQQEEVINSAKKNIKYDTKEFTLELLHSKFNRQIEDGISNEISIPFYQRNFVWSKDSQSRFIESILLGLPIPAMVFSEVEDGVMEVVDGSQRIRTIDNFLNDTLKLKGLEKLSELNGLSFNEFSSSIKRKIKNKTVRAVVLFDMEEDTLDISQELFDRLNTGGTPLTGMEIRKSYKNGKFIDFIYNNCSKSSSLIDLTCFTNSDNKRGYKEEFLIKYFAFSDSMDLDTSLNDYLDNYLDTKNSDFEDDTIEDKYLEQFKNMLSFVKKNNLVNAHVRAINKKNRLLAIYIGTTLALKEDVTLIDATISLDIFTNEFIDKAKSSGFNNLRENVELVKNIILAR